VRPAQTRREHVLEFHPEAQRIVESIRQKRALFSLADLAFEFPDFDPEEIANFAKRLGQVGIIRPFAAPLWEAPPAAK
jgi:hypothetical protein